MTNGGSAGDHPRNHPQESGQIISPKDKLSRRIRYLWIWELLNSFLLPGFLALAARLTHRPLGPFAVYSAALVTLMLWQGSAWWRIRLRSLESGDPISPTRLRRFARFRTANWVLLAVTPFVLRVLVTMTGPVRGFDLWAGGFFYMLALLEQTNYYYYQLSIETRADWRTLVSKRKVKRASLGRELEKIGA